MKRRIVATVSAAVVVALTTTAGHKIGEWFTPREWICSAAPFWC